MRTVAEPISRGHTEPPGKTESNIPMTETSILTPADRAHFLEKGYLIVRDAIPPERVGEWQDLAWSRLGYDRNDPATWAEPRVHLAPARVVRVDAFAPRAFEALCEAVGGRDRVQEPLFWGDVFVCNFSEGAGEPYREPSAACPGWHKDGYFFQHFLDSPEQGLLVIPCWTDVLSRGGGTFVATDSPAVVARYLAAHPEGVKAAGDTFGALVSECRHFEELTANAGDLVILHPFMLHAVSQNPLRAARFISNPILQLREPMCFDRADGKYSLVEQSILAALGVPSFYFQPSAPRRSDAPGWLEESAAALETRDEYRFA